jgi:hypothetical protein
VRPTRRGREPLWLARPRHSLRPSWSSHQVACARAAIHLASIQMGEHIQFGPLERWLRPGTYRCTYEFSSCEFVDARDLAGWRHRFPGIENSYICGDLKTDHARKEGCGGGFLGQEAPFTGLT